MSDLDATVTSTTGPPTDADGLALVRRYLDAWERGDAALFDEVLAPDFFDVMYGRRRERDELIAQAQGTDLVDREITIDEALTSGDAVVVRTTGRFTNPATGRRVRVSGMIWVRTSGGRITTGWGEHDRLGQLQQLGVAPTGARARAWVAEGLRAVRSPDELRHYRSRAARALVLLHEQHLRRFVATWHDARAALAALPGAGDEGAAADGTLLRHVLAAARGYLAWITEKLELGDPGIDEVPPLDALPEAAGDYVDHLLGRWRMPLAEVPDERLRDRAHPTAWGAEATIIAMLEHAVMHPQRHTFQLEELLTR